MNENAFWAFLEKKWEKGRATQVSCNTNNPDPKINAVSQYICSGHALLPEDYQDLSQQEIIDIGALLFEKGVKTRTKEAVLILLAHQPSKIALDILKKYCQNPDKALKYYALCALEECMMWNEA